MLINKLFLSLSEPPFDLITVTMVFLLPPPPLLYFPPWRVSFISEIFSVAAADSIFYSISD